MNKFHYLLSVFLLTECSNELNNTSSISKSKDSLVQVDVILIDSNEISSDYKEYKYCYFDSFANSNEVTQLAKDLYQNKDWDLHNEAPALALLDSLNAKNKWLRPFYFKIITKTYAKSDGYFSEGLGLVGKEFTENNLLEFISNFENTNCFNDEDMHTWAKIVLLELCLGADNNNGNFILSKYTNEMKARSKSFNIIKKNNIDKFCKTLSVEWKKLKNDN
ncbi:MAG: hypothetical protein ACEQSR_05860 [Candidatus Methylacidiphilales bacterium]